MKRFNNYVISVLLLVCSLHAFISNQKSDRISMEDKLTVIFAYHPAAKQDKDERKYIQDLQKTFKNLTKERYLKKIGIRFNTINLDDNKDFKNKYIAGDIQTPCLMFFKRGKLVKEETISITSSEHLAQMFEEKLHNESNQIGALVEELEDDYEEYQEDLEKARLAASYSIVYPNPWDYYYGLYSPYYGPRYHYGWGPNWGWGVGFGRRCR